MIARVQFKPLSAFELQELEKTLYGDGMAVLLNIVQARLADLSLQVADDILSAPLAHIQTGQLNEKAQTEMREACCLKIFLDTVQELRESTIPRQTVDVQVNYEPSSRSPVSKPDPGPIASSPAV